MKEELIPRDSYDMYLQAAEENIEQHEQKDLNIIAKIQKKGYVSLGDIRDSSGNTIDKFEARMI